MDPSKTAMSGPADAAAASDAPRPRVRDRIFGKACDLFYRRGIRAVGVDTIANEAGTNKMSFYRSFASKDELVAEYLRDQERHGWQIWDEIVAPHVGDARKQIEALFSAHVKETCKGESRGCAIANAAVEISDEQSPARAVIENYKLELRRRFRKLAREVGARDAEALGDALMLVWEGSLVAKLTFRGAHGPSDNAARAARALVKAYAD
jgi:AcrR family transcriptional regulator